MAAIPTTIPPPAAAGDDIDFAAMGSALWRGRWLMSFLGVLGIGVAVIYSLVFATPLFPARVTLALEAQQQQVITGIDSIFADGGTDSVAINTEIEVFQSRDLIGQLVDDLDLITDTEFNGLEDPLGPIALIRALIFDWERPTPEPETLRNIVIDRLTERLRVSNIRQSLAFDLSIETIDRHKSALIANRWAELYVAAQIQQELDEATRAIEFLSERTTELQANVEELEQSLAARMEASSVVNAELLQAQNLQLRDLRDRIEETQSRVSGDQAMLSTLRASVEARDFEQTLTLIEMAETARFSPIVQRARAGRLSEDAAWLAIEGALDDLAQDIARRTMQLATLRGSEATLSDQISAQSEELIALQQLEREAEAARLLYQTFLTRLQEASVQRGLESANSRILSPAVPRTASSPRVALLSALGAIFGLFLGAAFVLIREWRFAGFRTNDDLRRLTGLPVLGSLPVLGVRGRRAVLKNLRDNPNSVFAEAVRNLRTSILMTNPEAEPQVILVTSSIPGEGKTTASIALGRYFSTLEGKRTILLEADVRRQTLKAYVDETREPGVQLIDVVLGRVNLDNVDLRDPTLGIEVLMGSVGDFNAADLFESRRFAELIERLRARYDHIIIDSPPVLAVPDARVLSRYADHTVFAVRWNSTSRTQVRQGLDMLASIGQQADGLMLTQVNARKMKGYGYSGQYGYDGYSAGYYAQG